MQQIVNWVALIFENLILISINMIMWKLDILISINMIMWLCAL